MAPHLTAHIEEIVSFLAKLRTQTQASSVQALQYTLVQDSGTWRLQLVLRNVNTDVSGAAGGSRGRTVYCPQRDHLTHPPSFLTPQDIPLLRALIDSDVNWLQKETFAMLPDDALAWLSKAAEGGSLIWRASNGKELPLTVSEAQLVDWQWQFDADGTQYLQPKFKNAVVLRLPNALAGLNPKTCQLQVVAAAQYQLIKPWLLQTVAADQVVHFWAQHKAFLTTAGLPLPNPWQPLEAEGHWQPYLWAHTQVVAAETQHSLSLRARFEAETFCADVPWQVLVGEAPWALVAGDHYVLPSMAASEALAHKLDETLRSLEATGTLGQWQLAKAQQWRDLFVRAPDILPKGLMLLSSAEFAHPYQRVDKLTLNARVEDAQLELDFTVWVDGNPIRVADLLKQWLSSQPQGDYWELVLPNHQILLIARDKAQRLTEELGDWLQNGLTSVPLNQAYRIDKLAHATEIAVDWHGQHAKHAALLKRVWQVPRVVEVDANLMNATLRPYQWLGVYWLLHLLDCHMNGLLADDMGLGKTLQAITFFSVLKHQKRLTGKVLVVVPTSLLGNWEAEVKKFTHNLHTAVVHGANRHQKIQDHQQADVWITSYGAYLKDADFWQSQSLDWLVMDEAQTLKNPSTKIRQSLARLSVKHRLCLSGTPVENHLGEMWSILDLLNPGCLGGLQDFRRHYQKPIEQWGHPERFQQLLDRIAPLVLRRTKEAVAKDLPPKTEIVQHIALDEAQMAFYESLKTDHWQNLQNQLSEEGNAGKQQILILSALTQLRQAVCDPALLGAEHITSAKTEHCLDMLLSLVEEKRSVLVFSQFTRVLDILAKRLTSAKVAYGLLTGQTQHRAERVAQFQAGEFPVFLISLKAGGTGLNLTRADTVIHFDPWWNQAVEAQASDRVHRLGQDKPVFVYKLIAEDTIEEKIAALQASKAAMSDAVNQQAQATAKKFALSLQELVALWN